MDSGGNVIVTVSPAMAAAVTPSVRTNATVMTRIRASSGHDQRDLLDDVAQVAGGIPQRIVALGLADAVDRADHQPPGAGTAWPPGRRPFAERVATVVLAERGPAPREAAVVGDQHLADPVAGVEGDAFQG